MVFDLKYSFEANNVEGPKNVSWNWNLVNRIIQMCKIQCQCLFFLSDQKRNCFLKVNW